MLDDLRLTSLRITTGTQPAAMASTVTTPKCSVHSGRSDVMHLRRAHQRIIRSARHDLAESQRCCRQPAGSVLPGTSSRMCRWGGVSWPPRSITGISSENTRVGWGDIVGESRWDAGADETLRQHLHNHLYPASPSRTIPGVGTVSLVLTQRTRPLPWGSGLTCHARSDKIGAGWHGSSAQ